MGDDNDDDDENDRDTRTVVEPENVAAASLVGFVRRWWGDNWFLVAAATTFVENRRARCDNMACVSFLCSFVAVLLVCKTG